MEGDLAVTESPGRVALSECLEKSPLRRPDWRWQLAALSMGEKLPRRSGLHDPWVRRVVRYLKWRDPSLGAGPRRGRPHHDPVLEEACRIRGAPDPHLRGELEAWILAGEPIEAVAERCGLPAAVSEAYAEVFFDVRHRLGAEDHVLQVLFGRELVSGFSLEDLPSLWRFFAFMRGPHALAVLLHVFPGSRRRPWPASFRASPEERRRIIAACRGAVLARCLRRSRPTILHLRRLLALQSLLRRATGDRDDLAGPVSPMMGPADLSALCEEGRASPTSHDEAGPGSAAESLEAAGSRRAGAGIVDGARAASRADPEVAEAV
jgi:hypothetical protein